MELKDFFREHPRSALAFSGGVDSAYLLYAAVSAGVDVTAYYVKTAFQPDFELEDARRLSEELGARMKVIPLDILSDQEVCQNPSDRCYHCKRRIFGTIAETARAEGYELLLDGTNASDDADDRPGMRALKELSVLSPLRLCGLTKDEIRRLSREAGLFTWDKPAYACLATRIPTGQTITGELLSRTEKAEEYLRRLGFTDLRIRLFSGCARLQLKAADIPRLMKYREEILRELGRYYGAVLLDLEARDEH